MQIIRETGWTEKELLDASEDLVWAISQVMDLEGQKMKRESEGRNPQQRAPLPPPPPGYPQVPGYSPSPR